MVTSTGTCPLKPNQSSLPARRQDATGAFAASTKGKVGTVPESERRRVPEGEDDGKDGGEGCDDEEGDGDRDARGEDEGEPDGEGEDGEEVESSAPRPM
jgi:hypothetical protein